MKLTLLSITNIINRFSKRFRGANNRSSRSANEQVDYLPLNQIMCPDDKPFIDTELGDY